MKIQYAFGAALLAFTPMAAVAQTTQAPSIAPPCCVDSKGQSSNSFSVVIATALGQPYTPVQAKAIVAELRKNEAHCRQQEENFFSCMKRQTDRSQAAGAFGSGITVMIVSTELVAK